VGGSNCGEISLSTHDKSANTHYFIKLINGLSLSHFLGVYKRVKFSHMNTVAQRSVSQQELLLALKKNGI
jgi:hypothetical protein